MSETDATGGAAADAAQPEVVFFASAAEFRDWLERHHDTATELWMGLYRKGDPRLGITWAEAVPEALCFGWIDSTSYGMGDGARRQRWTPRKPGSNWSAINIAHVERLLAERRMHPAGIAAYEKRTDARSAIYSYENPDQLTPEEEAAVAEVPAAQAFWNAAIPSYQRLAASWIHSAKREQTRASRLATLIADCAAGRLIPSQRYGAPPAWLTRAAAAAAAAEG
jgi:uncharacterized protein YdeI (YjbR/CyaY-like superfamily)